MCECDLKGAGPCGGKLYRWEGSRLCRCADHIALKYYWSLGINNVNYRMSFNDWARSLDPDVRRVILASAPCILTEFWKEVGV